MKNMTPNKNQDHHFSSFAMGISLGVIAALLFGTEEGRKLVKQALDAIPEKYKKVPEEIIDRLPKKETHPMTPVITPTETPHHTTYEFESPPPPPPAVFPYRPQ